jgi:membrane associated rhomboid family serine protease
MSFVSLLWVIRTVEVTLHLDLATYGIYPRDFSHLDGVLFAPLIHASTAHLVSNSAPLLVMLSLALYQYPKAGPRALLAIYICSGIGVWLFARESFHFGASGLNHGLMYFLFLIGILRRDKASIAMAMIIFFLYGSMVWGILPSDPNISFESHFFGALSGVIAAFVLRHRDPLRPEKTYSWEQPQAEDQDPLIGDAWIDGSTSGPVTESEEQPESSARNEESVPVKITVISSHNPHNVSQLRNDK